MEHCGGGPGQGTAEAPGLQRGFGGGLCRTEHLRRHLDQIENFQTVAAVFKQLSDSSRLRIFWLLCHYEACVVNISALVDMTSPAVSHHLRQLRSSGLIVSRREGKEVYYRAADTEQSRLLHRVIEETMAISCPE